MAENSNIEWCTHTINLWWGCSKVHTGCKNCYAETLASRFGNDLWGNHAHRKRIKSAFNDLDKYQAKAKESGIKAIIFCGSMMDIFEESKPLMNPIIPIIQSTGDLRNILFSRITEEKYNDLIFLFLTKRPENISKMIPIEMAHGLQNVWFGTSISDAETCIYAEKLQQLKFQNLFLSIEPQIEPIEESDIHLKGIDWIIQGGESGHKKRPFDIQWAYTMRDICAKYKIPYFFKQIDKIQAIPEDLNIRQFPKW